MVQVRVNDMIYDDCREDCQCIVSGTSSGNYAFIQAVDLNTGGPKRYWGKFDEDNPGSSIERIMRVGGKWPDLPS